MLTLRTATPDDAEFLFSLYEGLRMAEVRAWGFPEASVRPFVAQQFAARGASWAASYPTAVDHIVELDGEPIGRLLLDEAEDQLRVVDIALVAAEQGRGLGTALLTQLKARGRRIRLSVAVDNPALRLYRRLGFRGDDDGIYATLSWYV